MLGKFLKERHSAYSQYKNNAMSPLTIVTSILGPALFYGVTVTEDIYVKIFLGGLVIWIIRYFIKSFEYLLKNDPDRLQTEGWKLEDKALDCLVPESKEDSKLDLKSDGIGTIEVSNYYSKNPKDQS